MEFIQPENILQAIASVDTFFVDSAHPIDTQAQGTQILCYRYTFLLKHLIASRETPLPDVVPNTFPGEPSIPPSPHPPSLPPRTSERPPSTEPPGPEPEIVEVPKPRRVRIQN